MPDEAKLTGMHLFWKNCKILVEKSKNKKNNVKHRIGKGFRSYKKPLTGCSA